MCPTGLLGGKFTLEFDCPNADLLPLQVGEITSGASGGDVLLLARSVCCFGAGTFCDRHVLI